MTSKAIRYYEQIGLIKPERESNGYRIYEERQLSELRLIQRCRHLGFSLDECRDLLALYHNKQRHSRDVKKLAVEKIRDIDHRVAQLLSIKSSLSLLADQCQGNDNAACPILQALVQKRDV